MRQEFTANVSHELKTPLTSISGFAELMMNGIVKPSDIPDFSATIYKESRRLITLVNDIIKISELDSRKSYEKDELNLYSVCEEVVTVLSNSAEQKKVTINLLGESVTIIGVKQIVFEMIYNICDNAIKYNKENGNVDIFLVSSESKATVSVRDTGIGIPYDHQNRVFERFYRVDKSHSKLVGGTGLGLAIVKHAAAYHGAEVSLESAEGKGTSVTITFNN
jgi:two-component system phosphate regulon sensor histidine kinase PhoR